MGQGGGRTRGRAGVIGGCVTPIIGSLADIIKVLSAIVQELRELGDEIRLLRAVLRQDHDDT